MTRLSSLSSPFMLGFDEIERTLERIAKSGDSYPPYNIERVNGHNGGGECIRITLALAGFAPADVEVAVEQHQLVIRGHQKDNEDRIYIHRGIATRQFQRTFLLAEGVEVRTAELHQGLLIIELVRPDVDKEVRRINITVRE
jgi:HSP20 family molecular chaperone IbpA